MVSAAERVLAPRGVAGALGPALDRLEQIHVELRGALIELRGLHAHLTAGHGSALAEVFDHVVAGVGAHVAKESRVIAPYLRDLERGCPDRVVLPSIAAAVPILVAEHGRIREAVADLGARLAISADACAGCGVAYAAAVRLATAASGHRTFVTDTLHPLALARERQLHRADP